MSVTLYNYENTGLSDSSAFEVGRQSNPGIDFISIVSQLVAALGPVFAPPAIALASVLVGAVGIAVANALFQAEQDRINAEAAAALASSSVEPVYGVPQTVAAPAPVNCEEKFCPERRSRSSLKN